MSLQYVKSKKGRDQLLFKGYLHTKERVFGKKTVWKCASYHKNHCPGRAHTFDNHVIKYSEHHHPPSKTAKEAKRMECGTKRASPAGPQRTYDMVLPSSAGLPETVPTKRLCIQNVKETIQRLRACLIAARQGMCPSQRLSAPAAESVPKDPPSSLSASSPKLPERSERVKDGDSETAPVLSKKPKASRSVLLQATREAGRQRFRSGTAPLGANPREILSCISEAAQLWLCPQEHNKDQIVDMVILEQFLAVLPASMQAWVKAQEPSSSMEAARLAEAFLREQEPSGAGQELQKDLITFEDVALCFSEKEWVLLDQEEKALYWNVMHQNYDNVAWLTSWETDSKGEEDLQQEKPTAEWLEKSNEDISWGFEQNSFEENPQERQPASRSEGKDARLFISDLKETTRGAESGLETGCMYCSCGKGDGPSTLVGRRENHGEEGNESAVLSGGLQESSEKHIPQNPEENLMKEGQKDKKQQPNSPSTEENYYPFREALRDHHDNKPDRETLCIAVDGRDQNELLTLLHDQNIYIDDDFECVALPEGSVFISVEEISQNPGENSQPAPINIYPLSELDRTCSQIGVNGTAALTGQKTIILDSKQTSSSGKEGAEEKSVISGNGLPELTADLLFLDVQQTSDPQQTSSTPEESSEHSSTHIDSQDDLPGASSHKRMFIPSSASTTEPSCSDCRRTSCSDSVLIKHRRRKKVLTMKEGSGRKTSTRSVLKHLKLKYRKMIPWQRAPFPSLPAKIAVEPIVVQLMGVLKQVSTDAAEIKSVVSRLHPAMTGIQKALGNLSGCSNDAEHRISDLEFTSQNTKAQLVQHCNDIKTIEAKLIGKSLQTNVIAGLWPLLGIKREMSP